MVWIHCPDLDTVRTTTR